MSSDGCVLAGSKRSFSGQHQHRPAIFIQAAIGDQYKMTAWVRDSHLMQGFNPLRDHAQGLACDTCHQPHRPKIDDKADAKPATEAKKK